MLPQTVLANDSAAQIELTDSAVQAEPNDAATQNNIADSSVASLSLEKTGGDDSAASDDVSAHTGEEKVYAAPAGKTSDSTVIHAAPVATGDDTDPGLWYTLLAGALACIVTLLAKHRGSRRPTICG